LDWIQANSQQNVEFPELQEIVLSYQMLLFEPNGFKTSRPTTADSSTFCGLVDILLRAGHWAISQLFTSILDLLLPDKDDERYGRRWGYLEDNVRRVALKVSYMN
jgi:hypothetical protein